MCQPTIVRSRQNDRRLGWLGFISTQGLVLHVVLRCILDHLLPILRYAASGPGSSSPPSLCVVGRNTALPPVRGRGVKRTVAAVSASFSRVPGTDGAAALVISFSMPALPWVFRDQPRGRGDRAS